MKGLTLSTTEQNRSQILNGVLERHWSMHEAAPLLGVSERQGWRLLAAYRGEGARGLAHKNRGRIPPNTTPEAIQQQVVALAQERYWGINHTHLTELLAQREGLRLSRPTVRRVLVRAGLSSPRQRRLPQHRCRRQRMPQEGMLLQLDGSHHAWLEDRGPGLTLLLAVDDATGTLPYALFQEQEDTRGYLSLLQGIIERRGVPMAVYTDGHAVFQPRRGPWELSRVWRKGPSTQWSRALEELGVTQILAHSPQAKGRVERAMAPSRTGWWRNCAWPVPVPWRRRIRSWPSFCPGSTSASGCQRLSQHQPTGQWTQSWTWVACCASRSGAAWPKTTRCDTTGALCNFILVWRAQLRWGPGRGAGRSGRGYSGTASGEALDTPGRAASS
jgi:transposase